MNRHPLVEDEAVEDNSLYNEEDFARLCSQTDSPVGTSRVVEDLPSYLKNAPTGPLRLTRGTSAPPSEISFADTESPVARQVGNSVKTRIEHVSAQKPGRVNKPIGKNQSGLQFRTVFTCEPCQFTTTSCHVFNEHLHKDTHFDIFAKNNLQPYCTFCKFKDNAHNFKRHIDSKKHNRKIKNYSSEK